MVLSNSQWLANAGAVFEIDQSIRFNEDDSAHLDRTPSSESNRNTFTFSVWIKRGRLTSHGNILSAGSNSNDFTFLSFINDQIVFADWNGSYAWQLVSTAVFRDPASWYNIVAKYDDTQSTASDRVEIYVNGSKLTAYDTESYPSQNYNNTEINSTDEHTIGKQTAGSGANDLFDGYMAEIVLVDGTALDASSFGETNSDTGQWVPKDVSGLTFGTNGFRITGADSSDLGQDFSGNNNDFASSGLAAADQVTDSPTNNFWTLNPLDSGSTLANGNLQNKGGSSTNTHAPAFPTTGKWYVEINCTDINTGTTGAHFFGICDASVNASQNFSDHATISAGQERGGQLKKNNSNSSTGTAVNDGNVVALAFDADNLTLDLFVNNSQSGSQITGLTDVEYKLWIQDGGSVTNMQVNFGQTGGFTYTPPTGFIALSTTNLPDPTIADPSAHFQTTVYTGNGTAIGSGGLEVNQSGNLSTFQPDWVWAKNRTTGGNENALYDAVRGVTKVLFSSTAQQQFTVTEGVTSFDSDGFTVGNSGELNTSGNSHVAWQWKANGAGSSNSDGSVTSTVSANTTAGFSICKFNPGGNVNMTFGHGLGVAPRLVIVKNLEDGTNWQVLHLDQGVGNKLFLNSTNAATSDANMWQNTAPTSTVVSMGTAQTTNEDVIAYCFAEIPGYSKISKFVGNGNADGTFVFTGFRPAFLVTKNISSNGNAWPIADNERSPFNLANATLFTNFNNAETTGYQVDLLSNGFKARTTDNAVNKSGDTIVYWAFAEQPFKTANAR